MTSANGSQPKLTTRNMRYMRFMNALLVLIIGVQLFIFTEQTDRFFAWTLKSPLTAAWLGAAYLAAFARELMDSRQRYWANARAAVPGVIVFSILMLVGTLLHVDRLHFNSPEFTARAIAWAWTIVYALVPLALSIFWVQQERVPGGDPPSTMPPARWALAAMYALAGAMFVLGVVMFLVPDAMASLWPWPLTPLTARATASWLVGFGIVIGRSARENDVRRAYSNFIFLLALGLLQAVALARYPNEFAWGTLRGWLYLLAQALVLVVGLYGSYVGYRATQRAALQTG